MAWVALDKVDRDRVRAQWPDVETLQKKVVTELRTDVIAMWYVHNPDSTVPGAATCICDATDVLMDIRHALSELLSFRIWYLEQKNPPNEGAADYMAKFYADDMAFRFYTAVEHLGNAINMMLEADGKTVKEYKKRGIGKTTLAYLNDKHQGTKIVKIWTRLLSSHDWNAVCKYRNDWVHNKPPIVKMKKQGDQFNRELRWKEIGKGVRESSIKAGGDQYDLTIEELMKIVKNTFALVFRTTVDIVDLYLEQIEPFRKQSLLSIKVVEQDDNNSAHDEQF